MVICMLCAMGLDEGQVFLSPFFPGGRQELGAVPSEQAGCSHAVSKAGKMQSCRGKPGEAFIRLPQALLSLLPA